MKPAVSVITLGTTDLARSRRFYAEGFGWAPVYESDVIIFYQLNGVVLGAFLTGELEADMNRTGLRTPGAFALAHNVATEGEVAPLIERLAAAGGRSSARPTLRRTAGCAAMLLIPMIMPGRLRGIRRSPWTTRAT